MHDINVELEIKEKEELQKTIAEELEREDGNIADLLTDGSDSQNSEETSA